MTKLMDLSHSFLSLLSPSLSECLACGQRGRRSAGFPSLCVKCAALIPWISSPRCPKCGRHVGCPDCTRSSEPSPIICNRSAVAYNSVMREWLGQYKYRGNERYAPLFGGMLERAYQMLSDEQESTLPAQTKRRSPALPLPFRRSATITQWQADILVPVPVSESRFMERGFNQAERMAYELSQRRAIPVMPLLIRTHHTGKQSFKSRAERLSDMKHAFAPDPSLQDNYSEWLHNSGLARPVRIIIVDDIYTTGSTIRACAESVRHMTEACGYQADLFSLTWARS
jgi:competence protein ComFC